MTEPCGCRIIYAQLSHGRISTDDLIDYCPLHLAAREMLAALKDERSFAAAKAYRSHVARLDALIARAEGKG